MRALRPSRTRPHATGTGTRSFGGARVGGKAGTHVQLVAKYVQFFNWTVTTHIRHECAAFNVVKNTYNTIMVLLHLHVESLGDLDAQHN
jgi:hypothetical protein